MIGMAILVIMTAAVAPAVSLIMQRDREDELIFRGRQYARAIVLFQRRYGRLPNTLKELVENHPRSIRKLFKEPMCNCDDWFVIVQNSPEAVMAGALPGVPPPGGPAPPTPIPSSFGGAKQPPNVGPIVGVRSQVKKNALREWRGQKTYDQWRFIAGDADRDLYPGLPGMGGPGNRAPGPAPPGPPPTGPGR